MRTVVSRCVMVALSVLALAGTVQSQTLEAPKGRVILTITGKVSAKNAAEGAVFDLAMIEKLPQQTFSAQTPWDKKPIQFQGPLLRDVLAAAKANGTTLKASALNDYQTTIPADDATKFDVILAYKMNGDLIPVRTKGPLFIVYPFDSKAELRSATYYERSAWQLKSLIVE